MSLVCVGTQINVDAGNAVGHGSTLMQAAEIIHAEALVGPRHQRELVLQEFDGLKVSGSERSSRYLLPSLWTRVRWSRS